MKRIFFLMIALWVSVTLTAVMAQTVIKGVVTDQVTNEPIIGASVLVKGTSAGTVTNFDGEFSITVDLKNNVTLQFSYIGYVNEDYPVKNNAFIRIKMQENAQQISEVVVVGYATQKKESVIGSIASIDNSTIVAVPVSNVSQALAGKLAGVQVVQPSGEVGRDEASVYVRGMATYGDARPLVVVDGIIRESFSQIDPNEIKSINVLKDASATAVYGVKGANGVIIVTTRRGASTKPQVSFSAQYAITQPTRIPDPLPAFQSAALLNQSQYAAGSNDTYSALELINYRTNANPYVYSDARWVDEVMKKTSNMQQYNVNVSGGIKYVKYFVSGGYLGQNGFYRHDPYTKFSRFNFRTNLDFDITSRLTASFSLGARVEKRQFPNSARWNSWDIYRGAFATGGYKAPIYTPDGSLASQNSNNNNLVGTIGRSGVYKENKSVLEMGLNVRYDLDFLLKGLAVRGQVAYDNVGTNGESWTRSYATTYYAIKHDAATGNDSEVYALQGTDTPLTFGWGSNWYDQKVYGEIGLEYQQSFGASSVTALFLANRSSRTIASFTPYADQGLVGRVTYDFDKRYFAEVNVGYNGSENFAKGNRYSVFPAFALGWLASNEKFIADKPIGKALTNLKLRGSLGWVGNDKSGDITKDDYQALRFIYIQQYQNGGGAIFGSGDNKFDGIYQGNIANKNVTWETGMKANVGLETMLFNNLVGLNIDFFYERRSDILTDISSIVPEYVGKGFMNANVGVVENKGLELELNHNLNIGRDFSYGVKANFSYARNKVKQKADPLGLLPYQREEGFPIGTPLMYKAIGVFESYEDIANSPSQMTLPGTSEIKPGDTKYLDFNNDGKIDVNDAFRQGYGIVPEIQYGISVFANYKGFGLSVLFQGSAHSQFIKNWEIMWPFSNNDNAYAQHWRFWTPETNGQHEYIRFYNNYLNNQPSGGTNSITMGNGDYVRLKNLEFSYTFPEAWISKIYLTNLRLYFSANNLFLWAKEPYLDPDNRDIRGGLMPQTRAYNFGVNINF